MNIDDNLLKELGAVDTVVYTMIADNPHITQKEIARSCKLSTRTVINVLQRLEDKHYIRIKNNKPNPNTYEVLHRSEKREQVKLYGMFQHVKLTNEEYQLLVKSITERGGNESELKQEITRLDAFMEQRKKEPRVRSMLNYESHCATLHRWYTDDHPEQPQVSPDDPLLQLIIHC